MQSYEYDVKPKRSHGKRYAYLGGLLLLLVIAALAVSIVALVRQQNSENDNDSLRSPTPKPQPTTTIDDHKSSPGSPSPETKPTTTTDNTVDSRSDSVVECGVNGAVRSPITRNTCVNTDGCVWQSRRRTEKTPACIYKDKVGYVLDGDVTIGANTWTARLKKTGIDTVYGMDVYNNINVQVEMINENALRIYMYPDKPMKAWEIPDEALTMDIPRQTSSHKLYNVSFTTEPVFGIVVERITNSTVKTKIIDTTVTGTIFSRQFMQLTTRLSSGNVYGFGEHNHRRFKHDMDWKTWPIFTRDVAPVDEWNLYGAHPVYLNLEEDGKANMVFLKNSHAMDVVLQPEPFPAITWKVIGGVIDFYVFLGPSPHEAVQQYISANGKPLMPSYWSLGFHLCKWGYENLTVVQDVVKRNKMAEIPQDVQWGDIDYMFNKFDFTVDKKTFKDLPEFVDELHQNGQRYVIIVDVGIGANETIIEQGRVNSPGYEMYKDGVDMDVFVKNHDGTVLKGEVWPGLTAFPDFSHTNATDFWIKYIKYFNDTEGVKLDGLWIDMNEPASFVQGSINGCNNNTLNYPPYVPHILDGHTGSLYYKTICMDSKQEWGNHYEVHSLYGHAESIVTYRAMTTLFNKTRPFIMTRSSFAGTGKYSFKWLGDNQSQWRQIPWSIIGILEFSMFGFPMIGADICGFWYAAQYEMCLRWSQLGAFYPFARNHNAKGWPHQDPAHWDETFISIARRALHIRYKILPYLYTLFHLAHTTSSMVARPLVFEFPEDKQTRDVDRQFLLGSAFLVTPVLEKGKTSVEGYFPKQRWFNYYDGTELAVTGQRITVDAPLPIIPLHLRGGYILPTQQPANTTVYSRQRPMGLIVAFNEETSARGDLFWDDGESIDSVTRGEYLKVEISATKGKYLEYKVVNNGYKAASPLVIDTIELYGLFGFPERIIVDSVQIPTSSVRSKEKIIELIGLNLNVTENHSLSWEFF